MNEKINIATSNNLPFIPSDYIEAIINDMKYQVWSMEIYRNYIKNYENKFPDNSIYIPEKDIDELVITP